MAASERPPHAQGLRDSLTLPSKTSLFWALTSALAASGAGCKAEPAAGSRSVADIIPLKSEHRYLSATISEAEYRRALARLRLELGTTTAGAAPTLALREAMLADLIDRHLLMLEAEHLGIRASTVAVAREVSAMRNDLPDFERALVDHYQTEDDLKSAVEERLVAGQLLKREAFEPVRVSEAEVAERWSALPADQRIQPARVHAAQIVLRTLEEGKAALAALKKGADFAQLAAHASISPEAERGGDLGWLEQGIMPSVFDEVCFSMQPGEQSALTPSEYGFHIFRVLELEPSRPLTLEEARPRLSAAIRAEKESVAEASYLDALRKQVQVNKDESLIGRLE